MVRGVNERGDLVDATRQQGGRNTGYVLQNGNVTLLDVPGARQSAAFQINGKGHVVGSCVSSDGITHGFLFYTKSATAKATGFIETSRAFTQSATLIQCGPSPAVSTDGEIS
jgi:uncharacterized membrane protein